MRSQLQRLQSRRWPIRRSSTSGFPSEDGSGLSKLCLSYLPVPVKQPAVTFSMLKVGLKVHLGWHFMSNCSSLSAFQISGWCIAMCVTACQTPANLCRCHEALCMDASSHALIAHVASYDLSSIASLCRANSTAVQPASIGWPMLPSTARPRHCNSP